jgi:DNA mismatch repair protein MutL
VIRLLDATTIGQIAAGEVIERPFSVVKELVENALDAGASTIDVAVTRGGIDAIEVRDDGEGIPRGDLPLALRRHATSKLIAADGLTHVGTLGFRGEGLASVAAVARVRLVSRRAGDELGNAVEASGESISAPEPVAAPPGTRVEVRDLFAALPVRREFLKAPGAEFSRISTFLATLSLGYPQVRFSLAHDGREVWTFVASPSLEQRLVHVFGPAARALVELDPPPAGVAVEVRGFVSKPGFDRPDRRMQLLFVNRRLLRTTLLAGAWSAGYATFAMSGRQPYGVLFVATASDRVDPNVHPTKSDVRLRDQAAVADAVRHRITATLRRGARERVAEALAVERPPAAAPSTGLSLAPPAFGFDGFASPPRVEELRVLAQLDDTFILATDGYALVLVDQHAAHERVAFETIARHAASATTPAEPLLVPYAIELEPGQYERFEATRGGLAAAGLEAEPFGERAIRIVATPAGYGARAFDVGGYIADLSDEIAGLNAEERVWANLACHSVVRAGEPLEHAEMSALLARLVRCENPMHCPHGRPTIVRFEPDAIARMFKRT